jgi:hypothetical protein
MPSEKTKRTARARGTRKAGLVEEWGKRIDFKKRAKAVCKPCWELKYCPYGPLVEDFPLKEKRDDSSCRIFGHDCPVFYVAEPFTETKELRRISRTIPRSVQFRVLKRENQICRECGKPVQDDDIHFDHIIPWTKGGPSEEHNVRLLCSRCNLEKGSRYEDTHLVEGAIEHLLQPCGVELRDFLLQTVEGGHEIRKKSGRLPTEQQISDFFGAGKASDADGRVAEMYRDLDEFFSGKTPHEITEKMFRALRARWGFGDGRTKKIRQAASQFQVGLDDLYEFEVNLIGRLGWRVDQSARVKSQWLRH